MRQVNKVSQEEVLNFTRTLYRKGADGAMRFWRCWTEGNAVLTEYGLVGTPVPMYSSVTCVGKNIGKANETTPEQQAVLEARSAFKNRLERKYSLTTEAASDTIFLPMKAKVFADHKKKIDWSQSVIVQPKLDGVRCMCMVQNGVPLLQSSGGKPWKVPHLLDGLLKLYNSPAFKNAPPDLILDGEIYQIGVSCEDISSLCKRPREETLGLKLYLFDTFDPEEEMAQVDRLAQLDQLVSPALKQDPELPFVVTPCTLAFSEREVNIFQDQFVEAGYEGAIIRLPYAKYIPGTYVPTVLKLKTFDDAEFLVTGAKEGVGKFEGCAVFECLDFLTGEHFDCTPKGTLSKKREYLENLTNYVGKQLKVQYFGRTNKNIPRFPVGLGFREEGV